MKSIIKTLGALGVMLAMPLAAFAGDPPARPVLAYGSVTIDGVLAPIGTKVVARANNGDIASSTLIEKGKYSMNIPGDAASVGSAITFKIGDKVVADTGGRYKMVDVSKASIVEYNLSVTTNSSSGSSGGGNSGSTVTTTTPTVTPTPTTPTTDTTVTAGSDENGRVLGGTDVGVVDGDIIQCKNSADPFAVYIVKIVDGKKYIRHIVSLEIFNHYKHLKWENLIQVQSLDGFSLSGWVRVNTGANGNPGPKDKVWEINGDQTKHWIDMTAAEFLLHGGSDAAIYAINQGELDLYKEGAAVKLQ